MKALGCHVFMGGFTRGVMDVMDVQAQLEIHGLGKETVEQELKIPFIMGNSWEDWPTDISYDMLYGNPRCTGFSCVTAGCGEHAHGPWSNQTRDIHDLVQYGIKTHAPIMIWESVQQAWSTGRPLLNYLAHELLAPKGYKVCHILLTAASFGNAQHRKRYFFVAYQGDKNFNVAPPELPAYRTLLRDAIGDLESVEVKPFTWHDESPHPDSYFGGLTESEWEMLPKLEHGWDLNKFARYRCDEMPADMQKRWKERLSDMPFSMHCARRLCYDTYAPTLFGGCTGLIHPVHDRPLTIRELSHIMGNDFYPKGFKPTAQIVKGICPQVGTWLAQQAQYYLDDVWGDDDFCSTYDYKKQQFVEGERPSHIEKLFHITEYRPRACRAYQRWLESVKIAKEEREYA